MYKIPTNLAISDSGFLFMPSTGETFTLNETGKEIFKLLQQQFTQEEIVKSISENYDTEINEIEKDLLDFIQQLSKLNLIKEK